MFKISFVSEKKFFFSLLFIFIFFSSSFASSLTVNNALEKKLYDSHVWKALLHIRNGKPSINNSTFLLSHKNFSLKNELIKTINDFENGLNICKYPARYFWLKEQLSGNRFKKFDCKDFKIYIEKTNPEDLELIFASENVSSPSSMMGHVFFNIKSKKEDEKIRQNAVSFFTVIDTFNIPLLITKSTITGMKGYFILNPYKKSINKYLYEEQRSIWEYKLKLTEEQKKLIIYHFWELKDIDMTYFFTGFNCATMIDDILSITNEHYINNNALWVTPKDVIKNAEKNNLISNTKMIPSIEWEIKMLDENINNSERTNEIMDLINKKKFDSFSESFFSKNYKIKKLEKQFISTYSRYLLNKSLISRKEYLKLTQSLEDEEYIISLENYKNPIKTFNDTQLSLSNVNIDKKGYMGITFLPASNSIYDDNREYFSENSLKIGEIDLLFNKDKVHLNNINIYDMKLLIPWNNITNDISKQFNVSYQKHYDENLNKLNVLNLSGGMGLTTKLHNDIWIYGLTNVGLGLNFEKTYPYAFSDLGFIMYEIFNMKTVLSHKFIYNQDNANEYYQNVMLNQALFIDKQIRFDVSFEKLFNDEYEKKIISLKLNYFF